VILAGAFIIFQLSTLLATQGLFGLNPGNKLPGRSAVCDLPGWYYLVGVLNMDFAACARTEDYQKSTVCRAPGLLFERKVQTS
jgi:hypothetical protein